MRGGKYSIAPARLCRLCSFRPSTHAIVVATVLAAAWAAPARGESGAALVLPGGRPVGGLTMELDTRWVLGSGYHPVDVEIRLDPVANSLSQRTFLVEFHALNPQGEYERVRASQFLTIEQGQPSGRITLLAPQRTVWTQIQVYVYEDGRRLDELSVRTVIQPGNENDISEVRPAALFIDSGAPLIDERTTWLTQWQTGEREQSQQLPWVQGFSMLPYQRRGTAGTDSQIISALQADKRGSLLRPEELPETWLAYTGVDLVCCTLDELAAMKANHASKWQAVRRWTLSGGNLLVFDLQMDRRLTELAAAADAGAPWDEPPINMRNDLYPQADGLMVAGLSQQQPPDNKYLWTSQLGLGQVVAIKGEMGGARSWLDNVRVLNTLGPHRWSWLSRHGISAFRDAADYQQYEIPGVGEPPLLTFMAAITLFVIVIGPVNYLLLKRWRRLYLLLVTVPAGAAAVTGSVFLFALIGDGLRVRVLTRSFTELDQTRGEMACWARQTYYAGLEPSGGLVFSDDTAVYAIPRPGDEGRSDGDNPRTVRWEDGQQRLGNGFLRSRTMEQLLVIRNGPTKSRLDVKPGPSGAPLASNQLGSRIVYLAVRDDNGNLYAAEDLRISVEKTMTATTMPQIAAKLRELYAASEASPNANRRANYFYPYRSLAWRMQQIDQEAGLPSFQNSRLGRSLTDSTLRPPGAGRFVAVLETCPWTEFGVRASSEPGGLHVVAGRWK